MARAMWRKKLDPAGVQEYIRAHAEPWPELIAQIKAQGIRNYSIFLDGDEVFGYFEHDDLEALDAMNANPDELGERWEAGMRPLSADKISPDQGMVQMRHQVCYVE
ncbi:L-rhamnose mutarotase [Nakamurella sp. UYEF19]|uniref:L-rhamnose mutarotase n=1 Tax=Nakamurella sp. UYEF19 TaxID=1756392 RepID=UPI003394A024